VMRPYSDSRFLWIFFIKRQNFPPEKNLPGPAI